MFKSDSAKANEIIDSLEEEDKFLMRAVEKTAVTTPTVSHCRRRATTSAHPRVGLCRPHPESRRPALASRTAASRPPTRRPGRRTRRWCRWTRRTRRPSPWRPPPCSRRRTRPTRKCRRRCCRTSARRTRASWSTHLTSAGSLFLIVVLPSP